MEINKIEQKIEECIETIEPGDIAGGTPSWVKKSLVGAGLSLALLGCSSGTKKSRQEPTNNLYAGPPTMKQTTKSMLPPDVDIYGAPPMKPMDTTTKPRQKTPDIVAEYAVAD